VWTGFDDERIKFTSMEYGQGARAALPIWAKFMKHCYSDPTLKLENRYFHIPDTIIGVPIPGDANASSDLIGGNFSIEYFTPKGFQYYQSNPGQPSEQTATPPKVESSTPEKGGGAAGPPHAVPAAKQKQKGAL
jgi:penicillin-binding protein 1A